MNRFFPAKIVLQAVLTGLCAGFFVVLFRLGISKVFLFVQNFVNSFDFSLKLLIFPIITALGGLLSGFLVCKFAPEAKGSGIPYVKMTLNRMGNLTRVRSIFVKFFAGIAGIGTGLSLGREGPSVQLGAGSGALIGKFFKMNGTDKDKLIAAGAGSAIAATFNAPIAGTVFVIEELVSKFSSSLLFPVLIATICADYLARNVLGDNPCFIIPSFSSDLSAIHFPFLIVFGVIAGICGTLFAKVIFFNNKLFDKMSKVPDWVKPAVAGFVIGIAGLFVPYVLGSGNVAVDMLLAGKFNLQILLLIFVLKFLLTPFCFGSGAAGGIFLPTLMLGAFLGYIFSLCINFGGISIDPVLLAVLGMGAFLAGVARTPITATIMVFEMTGCYNLILPIMLCAAIADLTAEKLKHKPIYSMLIVNNSTKNGIAKILSDIKVKEVMSVDLTTTNIDDLVSTANEKIANSHHFAIPVISGKNRLCGYITKDNIQDLFFQGNAASVEIQKIMNPAPITISLDENLYVAYFRLHFNNVKTLFVTDNFNRLKGVLTRNDIEKVLKDKS